MSERVLITMPVQSLIVYEWIRDNAPLAVKMSVRPADVAYLETRIKEALATARADGMREAARIVDAVFDADDAETTSVMHRLNKGEQVTIKVDGPTLRESIGAAILSAIGENRE